jgi:hypothetical protein
MSSDGLLRGGVNATDDIPIHVHLPLQVLLVLYHHHGQVDLSYWAFGPGQPVRSVKSSAPPRYYAPVRGPSPNSTDGASVCMNNVALGAGVTDTNPSFVHLLRGLR